MPKMSGIGSKKLSLGTQLEKENSELNKDGRFLESVGESSSKVFNDGAEPSGRNFRTMDRGYEWDDNMKKHFSEQNDMNKYMENRMTEAAGYADEDI